ncbi:hypothetical protein BDV30DRAFT_188006 [Aspergillus minisclerotigenes]|uniref:Uncharacterized protein n=1 Tax=Aspergillus minisclerotigenes TaxID=656917 RepID=A0A5N6IU70_9EURO|nr:hypothetical protein BDV30DRAFT_188006 [Aspergillus minisclerotigenes]
MNVRNLDVKRRKGDMLLVLAILQPSLYQSLLLKINLMPVYSYRNTAWLVSQNAEVPKSD